jgi:putative ABC transport system ATP-binding protein
MQNPQFLSLKDILVKIPNVFDLQIPDLELPCGNYLVWGVSGSGKTCFLEAMAGQSSFAKGQIQLEEKSFDLSNLNHKEQYFGKYISMQYQVSQLLAECTVKENIELFGALNKRDNKDMGVDWINELHLQDIMDKLPEQISGGEAQRASLCRALIYFQKILILDEPLVHVQESDSFKFLKVLLDFIKQQKGYSFVSSHDTRIREMSGVWNGIFNFTYHGKVEYVDLVPGSGF